MKSFTRVLTKAPCPFVVNIEACFSGVIIGEYQDGHRRWCCKCRRREHKILRHTLMTKYAFSYILFMANFNVQTIPVLISYSGLLSTLLRCERSKGASEICRFSTYTQCFTLFLITAEGISHPPPRQDRSRMRVERAEFFSRKRQKSWSLLPCVIPYSSTSVEQNLGQGNWRSPHLIPRGSNMALEEVLFLTC